MPYKNKRKTAEAMRRYRQRRREKFETLEELLKRANEDAYSTYKQMFGVPGRRPKKREKQ